MSETSLVVAEGEFSTLTDDLKRYLPFPEDEMNLVVSYNQKGNKAKQIRRALQDIYPDYTTDIPKIDLSRNRCFPAKKSGQRSAIIDKKYFDKKIDFEGKEICGIKIKGCRAADLPPFPLPFAPEKGIEGLRVAPEKVTFYKDDGTECAGFKNQPLGATVEASRHEAIMSHLSYLLGVPTNVIGIGFGEYSGVFYPGFYGLTDYGKLKQMGTGVFLLTGTDERISDLILNRTARIDRLEDSDIPIKEAHTILKNFQILADELNVDFYTLFGEIIWGGSGQVLNSLHSSGIIHGPRQSHYMNYTKPTRDYKKLKVCDFESSEVVSYFTNIQALRYMGNDLLSLLGDAANLYAVLIESLVKVSKSGKISKDCDVASMASLLRTETPQDSIIPAYTNGRISFEEAAKMYGKEALPSKLVEDFRKEDVAELKGKWSKIEKMVVANLSSKTR